MGNSLREDVFRYVRKKYKSEIEYLWLSAPNCAVFRHQDNQKWYGLVMDIPRSKLGLSGEEIVDVLNVKLDSPLLVDLLAQGDGYFPGYHMNHSNWISILLDGTVPLTAQSRWKKSALGSTGVFRPPPPPKRNRQSVRRRSG